MKIRNKLTYRFTLIVASLMILFSLAVYFFSSLHREDDFYRRLQTKGAKTARLLFEIEKVDANLLQVIDKNDLTSLEQEKVSIYDENNKLVYVSDQDKDFEVTPAILQQIKEEGNMEFEYEHKQVSGFVYKTAEENFVVITSAYDQYGFKKLQNLRIILIIGLIVSIGIVMLTGWFYSVQALKPISHVIKQVGSITASNMNQRVGEGNNKDEIAQLANTFNRMLDRLEYAFELQRSFVSNASHELRTPLTAVRGQLEVTLMAPRSEKEYKEALTLVLEEVKNLIGLTNGLLSLAQAGLDQVQINFAPVRLDEILIDAISECFNKYKQHHIEYTVTDQENQEEDQLIIHGNEQLLKTAFVNVIDNACKYTSNKKVKVILTSRKNEINIEITDHGIGVDESELHNIFEPFYRGKNIGTISGYGIGLPLTQRVIKIHKGNIKITSALNQGTTVYISLPQTF